MRYLTILILLMGVAFADHKYGRQVRFLGSHPIPKSEGGGMCYIEGPHVHIYAANKLEFRVHGEDNVFVGDPVAHGWDGPKYAYKGPHPIHIDAEYGGDPDEEYCYIEGPHYHYFAPPAGPDFQVVGGAYFFVGEPPHAMIEARPSYVGINAYYQPLVYTRPVVEVEPPHAWIGARADVWGPAVVVGTPGVVVTTPGIVVETPRLVVPEPSVHVGVDIGIGGGVGIVHGGPAPVFIEKEKHDNGHHKGHR